MRNLNDRWEKITLHKTNIFKINMNIRNYIGYLTAAGFPVFNLFARFAFIYSPVTRSIYELRIFQISSIIVMSSWFIMCLWVIAQFFHYKTIWLVLIIPILSLLLLILIKRWYTGYKNSIKRFNNY